MKLPTEILAPLISGGTWSDVAGTSVGVAEAAIKAPGRFDVAVLVAPGVAAGVTTTSTSAAAPCHWTRERLPGIAHAIVVNAGNANASTGKQGVEDTRLMAEATARALGCSPEHVLVCSTGVIGVPMPMDKVLSGIDAATSSLTASGHDAAQAILTTDLCAKEASVVVGGISVAGMSKGSGMIHPNMATMLAFVVTDAAVAAEDLQSLTEEINALTFNAITVDGDMSTNDTLIVQATGSGEPIRPGGPAWEDLRTGLYAVCRSLACAIAADGEGAEHLIECVVEGLDDVQAQAAARAVVRSPLVKTAIHGRDANWGRIVGALGAAGVPHLDVLDLDLQGIPVLRNGAPIAFDDDGATQAMGQHKIVIHARLPGPGVGRAWGCDLTAGYVRINADYRS